MNVKSAKTALFLVFSVLISTFSCQIDDFDERLQVYDDNGSRIKSKGTVELVGLPGQMLLSGYYPWKLYGKIVNGKMIIDFPDVKLTLREGVQMDMIRFNVKDSYSTRLDLYKKNNDYSDRLYIYYLTDDLIYKAIDFMNDNIEQEIELKAGWNFIEERYNPNFSWVDGNEEPFYIYKFISQDINDVLNEGYRWTMDL